MLLIGKGFCFMKLLRTQIERYENYLRYLEALAEEQQKAVSIAVERGDLSENAEYDSALLELIKTQKKINKIKDALQDYEELNVNELQINSNKITYGSIVRIAIEKTGINTLDFRRLDNEEVDFSCGEDYEIVEKVLITIPNSEIKELSANSIVGRKLFGKQIKENSDNVFVYTDELNTTRTLHVLQLRRADK